MSDVCPSALGSPAAGARSQPLMIGVHFRSPKCTAPQPSASWRQDSPTYMATSAADKFVIALDICRPSNSRSSDNAGRTPLGRARSQSPGRPADIAVRTLWRRAYEQGDCRRNCPGREAAALGGGTCFMPAWSAGISSSSPCCHEAFACQGARTAYVVSQVSL